MSNRNWLDRSLKAVRHPCTQMKLHDTGVLPLVPVARGRGAWLYDFEGRRYLDAISSWWVNLFGHAHPRINAAIKDQLDRLEQVILAGFTDGAPVVELSERLAALTGEPPGHRFYASDGSSRWSICFELSFILGAITASLTKTIFSVWPAAITARPWARWAWAMSGAVQGGLCAPAAAGHHRALAPRAPGGTGRIRRRVAQRAAHALEAALEAQHEAIAALIVEPLVQGATGMAMYDPAYLRLACDLCDRYQVHLITDEIMVGFGRTGTLFAHEQAGIRPDFLRLSKGLTGGYLPLSVVLTTDDVFAAFYDDAVTRGFLHSHSYTGNPLACRAALATLDIFAEEEVLAHNRRFAERFTALLEPLANHPRARYFRQRGMIWAVDIDTDDPDFRPRFYREALRREILLRPLGTTVYFMPPYILDDAEATLLAERAVAALNAALADLGRTGNGPRPIGGRRSAAPPPDAGCALRAGSGDRGPARRRLLQQRLPRLGQSSGARCGGAGGGQPLGRGQRRFPRGQRPPAAASGVGGTAGGVRRAGASAVLCHRLPGESGRHAHPGRTRRRHFRRQAESCLADRRCPAVPRRARALPAC